MLYKPTHITKANIQYKTIGQIPYLINKQQKLIINNNII